MKFTDKPDLKPEVQVLQWGCVPLEGWNHPGRSDHFWRIYWNSSRGACVTVNNREYHLVPSQIFTIPPNTLFVPHTFRPTRQLFIHFTLNPEIVAQQGIYRWSADKRDTTLLHALIKGVEEKWQSRLHDYLRIYELIHKTLQHIPWKYWKRTTFDPRIAVALKTMREQTSAPISNEQLAHAAGMSINGFLRLFRAETGASPQRYHTILRVEKAGADLIHTDFSIETIAENNGFCDRGHFTKIFKKYKLVPPAEYRRHTAKN